MCNSLVLDYDGRQISNVGSVTDYTEVVYKPVGRSEGVTRGKDKNINSSTALLANKKGHSVSWS